MPGDVCNLNRLTDFIGKLYNERMPRGVFKGISCLNLAYDQAYDEHICCSADHLYAQFDLIFTLTSNRQELREINLLSVCLHA